MGDVAASSFGDRFSTSRARRTFPATHGIDGDAILGVLGSGVIVVSADGTITNANPHAARILSRTIDEIEGASIDRVLAPLARLVEVTGRDARGEITIHGKDGSPIALGFALSTLDDAISGEHHVVLFQDISAVLELRKQRDRLLQMAVLGEVMPALLHELRNPLAAVTTMLELLVEDAGAELQGDLHAVLSEVRRMALGLQGLGGFVRSMHSPSYNAIDLAVREVCRLLEQTALRRGVTLEAIGADMPVLRIDRGATCGVVFNLVKNAIDASPPGAKVRVDARIERTADVLALVLSVADQGSGMTSDVLARCRDLFFTTKDMGSGIGLALCAQVVEASGGSLSIDSAVGRGTEVVIRIPLPSSRRH